MKKHEYLAIKNFFLNSMKCGRKEIREIVQEIIWEIAQDEILQYLETNRFRDTVARTLQKFRHANFDDIAEMAVRRVLNDEIQKQFKDKFSFSIAPIAQNQPGIAQIEKGQ